MGAPETVARGTELAVATLVASVAVWALKINAESPGVTVSQSKNRHTGCCGGLHEAV
jgi:hypothetical protein